ncbi:hypothetical protein FYK55_18245 [Roseiconus nitratireducens]|uniref:Uncharacterized protein n=1 Tax=Roseiconus nitratireducens TaxID=2605748 RepID=A0A5M6D6P1_9BACT|nr:hypothetical protein [Roseiconus nitratireducens]KAA5541499.1 hypothetical protein FYK55_18245 [Roseiconus nitratireducens]
MSQLNEMVESAEVSEVPLYHWRRKDFECRAAELSDLVAKDDNFEGYSLEYPKTARMAAEELRCRGLDVDIAPRLLLMAIFGQEDEAIWSAERIDELATEAELDGLLLRSTMFCSGANVRFGQMMLAYLFRCVCSRVSFGPQIDLDRFEYAIVPGDPYNRVQFLPLGRLASVIRESNYG